MHSGERISGSAKLTGWSQGELADRVRTDARQMSKPLRRRAHHPLARHRHAFRRSARRQPSTTSYSPIFPADPSNTPSDRLANLADSTRYARRARAVILWSSFLVTRPSITPGHATWSVDSKSMRPAGLFTERAPH